MSDFLEAKEKIREIIDFPRAGIHYYDLTPVLRDGRLFGMLIDRLTRDFYGKRIDFVVSPESRGFILGSALALKLGAGFIPVRRKSKLPFKTIKVTYDSAYPDASKGENELYMHEDSFPKGCRVIVADDMMSTGGTIHACATLAETLGADVVGAAVMVDLMSNSDRSKTIGDLAITSCINF